LVVVAAWLAGYLPRRNQEDAAVAAANEVKTEIPSVTTTLVRQSPADVDLVLPGSVSALDEASIYARATGYVVKRYVDIGDHVKEGQLLAQIDAPDLDQQVAQARARWRRRSSSLAWRKLRSFRPRRSAIWPGRR
jgi:multidrug efflux pump subunit AcrA (membrane-fusion protein)